MVFRKILPLGLKQGQVFWQHLPQQQQQQHQKQADMIKMTTMPTRTSRGNKSPKGALHNGAYVSIPTVFSKLNCIDK